MQVMLTCPCGWEFWTEKPAPGQAVRCPHCGRAMTPFADETGGAAAVEAPDQPAEGSAQSPQEPDNAPTADPAPSIPPPPMPYTHSSVVWSQPAGGASAPGVPPVSVPPMPPVYRGQTSTAPAPPVGLAVTSMVLGIVSILFCPCSYGLLSIPIATVAVLMGVISITKKRGGKGFAIVGISTGGVGLAIGLTATAFFTFAISSARTASSSMSMPATMPVVAGGGTYDSDDTPPGSVPSVMTAQQIRDAFATPAEQKPTSDDGALWLRRALDRYERRNLEWNALRDCVLFFRRYLKCEGLERPIDSGNAEKFDTACDELTDRFLSAYRKAGQLEQDGEWKQAQKAYEDLSRYSLEAENLLARNIEAHRLWCQRKQHEKENQDAGSDFEFDE